MDGWNLIFEPDHPDEQESLANAKKCATALVNRTQDTTHKITPHLHNCIQ